ncbi:unnamed protein product [Closterium sp. NIES-54]
MVTTTTPGGQRVSICTCTRTGRHLATFTRWPGSSLYTLTTKPTQVAAFGQVSASSPVAAPCSCRLLSHQTLLWHHRLGHPSLPRLHGMHSRLLVFGLPRSLPPLPPSPAPPCLPCVEGRQRAAPHSSSFPPTTAPLQTLHMDVWGQTHVSGQDRKRYFLLVVDDYTRYTTVFPLRSKGEVPDVLIPWIHAIRLQLRERFREDLPVLRLHSVRGVMEVARTSMIHVAAPHFLWPFAVRYTAHQLNLWPCVSLPETSPTLRWTGKVGDASVFWVWGSCAFVRDTSADKLSSRAIPCVCLGFPPDAPRRQFYHPTLRRCPAPSGVSQVDPLPLAEPVEVTVDSGAAGGGVARGAASGGVEPAGAEPRGAEAVSAEPGGAEPEGPEHGGAETEGTEPGGVDSEGAESEGAEPRGNAFAGGPRLREWFARQTRLRSGAAGAGGSAAGGTRVGGAGVTTGAGCTGGARAAGPRGARSRGTGASGACGVRGAGAGDPGVGGAEAGGARDRVTGAGDLGAGGTEAGDPRAGGAGAGGAGAGGAGDRGTGVGDAGAGGTGAGGAGVGGAGAGGTRAGGAGAGGTGAGGTGAGGTVQRRPFFVPPSLSSLPPPGSVLRQVLNSPLPAPSPYAKHADSLTECHEPESCPALPVRAVRTGHRVPRPRPPSVPGTHIMALRPSSVPLRVPLPSPPASSLADGPDPESDLVRAASPTVTRLLATIVTDPSFESTAASALVVELVDFAAACRLDYAASLVAESESDCPSSVGGECALGTNDLEDRKEDFECLAAAVPHLVAMLLASEGDPDAPDIPTPRSYAEAITRPYSSQWQTAMDAEMASWKSTGTYVDAVPPHGVNIVDGMYIFRVKQPPGSSPVFKARYVSRGFSQRQGVEFFQTFSPTPKMTTLRVLLHIAAQCEYELHSLDFNIAFLQGSLHEEIWLRRPPGFTGSFPAGTQWSLRRPVYGLRQAPRVWHDTLRTTLAALGFAPSTADPSLFLRTDNSLPPFYILVYVDDLVFAAADSEALALVKLELQTRHTYTDLVLQRFDFRYSSPLSTPLSTGHSLSAPPSDEPVEPSGPYPELVGCLMYLMTCTRPDLAYPLSILARYVVPGRHRPEHWEAAKRVLRYLWSTSDMGLVLGGRGPVDLTGRADASWGYMLVFLGGYGRIDPLLNKPFYLSGLVTRILTWYLNEGLGFESQCVHFGHPSAGGCQRSTGDPGLILEKGYRLVVLGGYGCTDPLLNKPFYPYGLVVGIMTEIYAGAMAAQELRWLTYLLTDFGERPCSPPVMYIENKAMIVLCQEHRLEHRTKHNALRYFLARELQQRGHLRLAYVATRANTADIFTKALQPGLANGGGFLGGGVANSYGEPKDVETSFVGLFVVKAVVVVEAGYFDGVVITVVAKAEGVLRGVRWW